MNGRVKQVLLACDVERGDSRRRLDGWGTFEVAAWSKGTDLLRRGILQHWRFKSRDGSESTGRGAVAWAGLTTLNIGFRHPAGICVS